MSAARVAAGDDATNATQRVGDPAASHNTVEPDRISKIDRALRHAGIRTNSPGDSCQSSLQLDS